MLTTEQLKSIRQKALDAVADMGEGELKVKAFEVVLQHLLTLESRDTTNSGLVYSKASKPQSKISKKPPGSTKSRILLLRDEGFYAVPRSITEIKQELQAHGWMHSMTSLSGPLQSLVRTRELRRLKEQGKKMKVWKYVNP